MAESYPSWRCCDCSRVLCYGPWSRCEDCYGGLLERGEIAIGARLLLPQRPWLKEWYEPAPERKQVSVT